MNLKYKIVEVHPQQHSIVVRFYTDTVTEHMLAVQTDTVTGSILRARTDYNIDLPIPAPVGEALDAFIYARAPRDWLAIQEAVLNPEVDTSMTNLSAMLGVEKVLTPPAPVAPATVVTTSENIQTV